MNKIKKILFIFLVFSLILSGCSKGDSSKEEGKDLADKAFNETLDLTGINKGKEAKEENGERIIMDSVALSQLADILDINLAGVPTSRLGKMPKRYENTPQIGLPMNPNMEVVASLNPTMLYAPDSLSDWINEGLTKNNIKHEFVNIRSVDNLYKLTKKLATRYNKEDKIASLDKDREKFFKEYNEKIKNIKKPKVLLLMGLPGSYIVATENSYAGNLLKLSGAENIIKNTDKEFVQINMEEALKAKPDYILLTAHAMPDTVMAMFDSEFKNNAMWKHFDAYKNNRVIKLDSSVFGMTAEFNYKKALNDLAEIYKNK